MNMEKEIEKKVYSAPQMKVVELQASINLLQDSGFGIMLQNDSEDGEDYELN
ncbi:hypothetical protein [Fibrobacter sp. UWEL]|uniref:hypothetical protein n=1 Tax=Fibrobacter sp. UWEL TaxID=1896209 RepID=UPI00091CDC7F|nr:hypothetical protein [Fibrobacter sp. UWEL]SHL31105.1 hypothetical protein SAMN05720468_12152 [Fibrobacter sp. UWEL]